MHVTQYRPAYFEGFENEEHDVSTLEELLALPFVKNFAEGPPNEAFHQFSLDDNRLMAEYKRGKIWWVVAFLDDPAPIRGGLPKWEPRH